VDLFATVLDGFNIPLPEGTHGRSLLPYILDTGENKPIREMPSMGGMANP